MEHTACSIGVFSFTDGRAGMKTVRVVFVVVVSALVLKLGVDMIRETL